MNKFTVSRADISEIQGTSLQGYMVASYEDLVKAFGEPTFDTPSGDGKTDVEWLLKIYDHEFDEDHVVTVYNWKDYDNGVEARSNPKYEWHIGGRKKIVVGMLIQAYRDMISQSE